ncbi:hydantoinase/oxoprolinase N-terminal domain-containing protein [Pseudomonas kitaguniensis]|uniref:hydantoinase/oxoprolinase N-terminal domain-containing protein n=1 Tax=Pseudomonas kitaguniensis TaxID=2607908 RepID=UPI00240E59E6|nr:hydantoinase/oxoprolinase N-terminal domain-containing protein [Pseudomonas kitaguniensis]
MSYRMGIDVGGTNTDAVLLDETGQVIAQTKEPTTADVMSGIEAAIATLLGASGVPREAITQAMLGTTQCTNAIVERKALNTVAHLRLGAPRRWRFRPWRAYPMTCGRCSGSICLCSKAGSSTTAVACARSTSSRSAGTCVTCAAR